MPASMNCHMVEPKANGTLCIALPRKQNAVAPHKPTTTPSMLCGLRGGSELTRTLRPPVLCE